MRDPAAETSARDGANDDYEVVRLSIGWGALSILAFASMLIVQLGGSRVLGLSVAQATVLILPLSGVGFVLGTIGVKYGRDSRLARLGVFLNGIVLFCILVLLPLTTQILRRLG